MNPIFNTPFGNFSVNCDNHNDPSIQAWNQADAYLLNMLDIHLQNNTAKVAIINDEWGALSKACQSFQPEIYSDSAIFRHWLNVNTGACDTIYTLDKLERSQAKVFLMKLPKNLHYFQHQLSILSKLPDITVYIAGMQKYWPGSFYKTAQEYFTHCVVMDGVKKAKCMIVKEGKNISSPTVTKNLSLHEFDLFAINYPNVFSRESLDIGTRFFLENFPDLGNASNIIDLACGNGLLGIMALKQYPDLHTCFVDESYYATLSCADSLALNKIDPSRYRIFHNDALAGLNIQNIDAILCNPPFHQLHRIGDHIATTMIKQSHDYLKPNGILYLIGNRHLNYATTLKKYFAKVSVVAENPKFILLAAKK